MRVYISGAFTGSVELKSAMHKYQELGLLLKNEGYDVYLPHTKTNPIEHSDISPQDVYGRDRKEVFGADILLALLDEPSHGVGAEIALALNHDNYVIGAYPYNSKVSRFIQGLLETSNRGICMSYCNLIDLVDKFIERADICSQNQHHLNDQRSNLV